MTTNSRINYPVYVSKTQSYEPMDSYRPSVPLSVYRELVKELQASQGQVERLELQNQDLVQQNQRLQENMEQVLHGAQQLQQIIDTINQDNNILLKRYLSQKKINSSVTQSGDRAKIYFSSSQVQSYRIDIPPQSSGQLPPPCQVSQLDYQGTAQNEFRTPINGWLLAIGIFLIVVMSCTGALLVVNLKFNPNNR